MRDKLLIVDREGAAVVPRAVRERWDGIDWLFETNGTAALARLKACKPVLAIVNLQLPDMCGTELVERVRKGRPGLPVVMTSSRREVVAEKLARSAGVVGFLHKPVSANLLDELLRSVLREIGGFAERVVGSDTIGGE